MRLSVMLGLPMWLILLVLIGGGYWFFVRRSA